MVNLFINYYIDKNKERHLELMQCFLKNRLNNSIDKMYVFIDIETPAKKVERVIFIDINSRPTFSDFFELINRVSIEGDINIIANSDIYFDEENIELIKSNIKENECYALARWDIQHDGSTKLFNRPDTNDVWVFKGKIKPVPDCENIFLGKCGCDNAIAERIQRAGYVVKNPCLDIKTFHLHLTQIRNYDRKDTTPKPYLLIHPHKLNSATFSNIIPA